MDRGAWRAMIHGGLRESDTIEWLMLSRSWLTYDVVLVSAV